MSWRDLFRSRYVRMLEETLDRLRKEQAEETERIKTLHAQELERAITEGNRGWAEADRLRQYLIPGLATSTRFPETATDNVPHKEVEGGTPFQRVYRRVTEEDYKRYQAEQAAKAQPEVKAQEKN